MVYELAGITNETTPLAPAYHCLTMLDPAIHLGAEVQLYPLNPDLSPRLEQLDRLLHESSYLVKVLLATHFFGVRQDFGTLRQWCDRHAIVLIEDGSDPLFTESYQAPGIGCFGEFIVSSPHKFFPGEDGGLLHAPNESLLEKVRTDAPLSTAELRKFKRTLEQHHIVLCKTPNAIDHGALDRQLADLLQTAHTIPTTAHYYTMPSPAFSQSQSRASASRISRWLVRQASPEKIAQQRRTNFVRWLDAVRDLPNCHPLYSRLPDDCVPYMFPLYIDHPSPHFDLIKRLAFLVWRWDEMAALHCHVTTEYRVHLLHSPCHRSLTSLQMEWLTAVIRKVPQLPVVGEH